MVPHEDEFTTVSMSEAHITVHDKATGHEFTFMVVVFDDVTRVLSASGQMRLNDQSDVRAEDIAGRARRYADGRMAAADYVDRVGTW